MPNVGIDLGSYALKVVTGKKSGNAFQVTNTFEVFNPVGAVFVTDAAQRKVLVETLGRLFKDNKIQSNGLRVALPETAVVTKVVTMPLLSDAELASAIQWQVEQHIPIPLEEMQYEYTVLRRSQKKDAKQDMDVFMVGVKKAMVQFIADLLLDAGLDAVDMETDTLAQLRLFGTLFSAQENFMLVHIGAGSTSVACISKGLLRFVYTIPIAGMLFSRAVERGIGLDVARAEEYKRSYGLASDQLEGRVRSALAPVVQSLATELQKASRFFQGQLPGERVSRVFVSGGSLYLPGLLPFLSQALSLEVVPVGPSNVQEVKFPPDMKQESRFSVAVGLAMKSG